MLIIIILRSILFIFLVSVSDFTLRIRFSSSRFQYIVFSNASFKMEAQNQNTSGIDEILERLGFDNNTINRFREEKIDLSDLQLDNLGIKTMGDKID